MFIKPSISNPCVPYNVLVDLARFAPGGYSHDAYQDIASKFKGFEYFEDDTSFVHVYFGHNGDLKLFKISINWVEYAVNRKVIINNIDAVASDIYEYLYWSKDLSGISKDLHKAYYAFLTKVFVITWVEKFLTDITKLPCYSDYTWLKEDSAEGAETLDVGKVYVVYE